jgi:hypothetical protein
MNQVQKTYAKTKASYEAIRIKKDKIVDCFFADHDVTDEVLLAMDEETADRMDAELKEKYVDVFETFYKAKETLKKAENALIEYGLSIVPVKLANEIRSGLYMFTVRQKLLDLNMSLDPATVPMAYRRATK